MAEDAADGDYESRLNRITEKMGVLPWKPPAATPYAHQFLEMDAAFQFRKMTPLECSEVAIELALLARHVSDGYQRWLARANRLDREIKMAIAGVGSTSRFISFEERALLAIKQNPEVAKMEQQRLEARAVCDRLGYHAQRIREVAEAVQQYANVKHRIQENK